VEVNGETAKPESVSSDVKVEIPVPEEIKTDKEEEKVEQLVSEDQMEK